MSPPMPVQHVGRALPWYGSGPSSILGAGSGGRESSCFGAASSDAPTIPMTNRKGSPSPFAKPAMIDAHFVDDEAPTRPNGREYRAAMLVRAWAELSPKDQAWIERLLEFMAWAKEK